MGCETPSLGWKPLPCVVAPTPLLLVQGWGEGVGGILGPYGVVDPLTGMTHRPVFDESRAPRWDFPFRVPAPFREGVAGSILFSLPLDRFAT